MLDANQGKFLNIAANLAKMTAFEFYAGLKSIVLSFFGKVSADFVLNINVSPIF